MLNQNHPDDERLSALASRDTDATADATLTAHVTSCDRCTELVNELGLLRVALADLPDLRPSRSLQLVPPVEADHAVDRLGGWARRFFAPVLVSGAALVLVGVIGTASPAITGMASSGQAGSAPSPAHEEAATAASEATASDHVALPSIAAAAPGYAEGGDASTRDTATAEPSAEADTFASGGELAAAGEPGTDSAEQDETANTLVESSRSPWPMVLFAGVALIVGALLMRWILAPRAS